MAASPSRHLSEDRWPKRATPPQYRKLDPRTAWARGHPLDVATGHTTDAYPRLPQHDEARIDPETRTVLFRRGQTLVTAYDLDVVTTFHGHAVRAAVADQYPELIQHE